MKKLIFAALISNASIYAHADNGAYGEIFIGSSAYDIDTHVTDGFSSGGFSRSTTQSFDGAILYGVRAGFQFTDYIAIESSYSEFGEGKDTFVNDSGANISESLDIAAVRVGVKGILPLTNYLSLNARVGRASWEIEVQSQNSSSSTGAAESNASGEDFYYGVGVEYNLGSNFYTGLEYSVTKFEWGGRIINNLSTRIRGDVSNVALSVGYRF